MICKTSKCTDYLCGLSDTDSCLSIREHNSKQYHVHIYIQDKYLNYEFRCYTSFTRFSVYSLQCFDSRLILCSSNITQRPMAQNHILLPYFVVVINFHRHKMIQQLEPIPTTHHKHYSPLSIHCWLLLKIIITTPM